MQIKFYLKIIALSFFIILPTRAWSSDNITISALESLPPLPEKFAGLSYEQRINWLKMQREKSTDDVEIYRLTREMAFQHDYNNNNELVNKICQELIPIKPDLSYRLKCLTSLKDNDEAKLVPLLELQKEAIEDNNLAVAAEALSIIAWVQSSTGDLEQAFSSYEMALPLAEIVNVYLLNDITLNLATLYIVHGDNEYVTKGIKLMLEAIKRLKLMQQEDDTATSYVQQTLAKVYFNLGIAKTFHQPDYAEALKWFQLVDPEITILRQSILVFSSLAYAELAQSELAKEQLKLSFTAPVSDLFNSDYLLCYQQLIQIKLALSYDIDRCESLSESTPLEVQHDLFQRMIDSNYEPLSLLGLKRFYALYLDRLKPLLKQNSAKSASRAELSRLQQESRLKGELIEKEKALTAAEQGKIASQKQLTIAVAAGFLLLILLVLLQLRQKQKLADQFARMSLFDSLTGLHNRHYLEQNIQREINFVKRSKDGNKYNPIAIYLFDIDHFKKVNDTYGHDVGDKVLKEFARRVNQSIRETDLFIRWGGEEFLLVARLFDTEDYHQIAQRICHAINQSEFAIEQGLSLRVTCTIGGVIYPNSPKQRLDIQWPDLIKLADNALYMGKRQQRNCWVCIDEILQPQSFPLVINQELEASIKQQLVVVNHSITNTTS
ncbi:diguanylate cyclase [Rheinheimera sp. WS51]|uniref:tetratricopeptide repeat-containing diguanylate cyclase n=1 Tax=Rheinheimera sp. WS51 TaxID=3425886 RepID=UPI003D8A42B0